MNIDIPNSAVKFILYQRTNYQILWNNKYLKGFLNRIPILSYNKVVELESLLFKNRVKKVFNNDMISEYKGIQLFLPPNALRILDIGCGMAGIDVLLYEHYKNSNVNLFLLDKTEINKKIYYGFEREGSFYNSLTIAKSLLVHNGINPNNIHLQEVETDSKIHFKTNFDLIISLISWGYHYPVSTYLNQVYGLLKPKGVLIMDVRKDSNGYEELKNKFHNIRIIFEKQKSIRISAHK